MRSSVCLAGDRYGKVQTTCRYQYQYRYLTASRAEAGLLLTMEATYRNSKQCIGDEKLLIPPQHHTSWKMSTWLCCNDTGDDLLKVSMEYLPETLGFRSTKPSYVLSGYVHRTSERFCPIQMRCVIVRMADDNRLQAAFRLDEVYGLIVQVGN